MGTILIGTCARGSDFHAQGKLCAQEINKTCQPLCKFFLFLVLRFFLQGVATLLFTFKLLIYVCIIKVNHFLLRLPATLGVRRH